MLIISYHYLPMKMAASFRVQSWVKYLPHFGWEPIVLTRHWSSPLDLPWTESEEPESFEKESDWGCLVSRTGYQQAQSALWNCRERLSRDRGPTPLRLLLRKSISYALKNVLLLPDEFVGWRPDASSAGRAVIERSPLDAMIATGPPWTDFLVGKDLGREYRVPWVADYRDPWTQPTSLKHGGRFAFYFLVSRFIEKNVTKSASALIHNSESHSQKLSEILNREVETIPNGYDPEQFDKYRGQKTGQAPFTLSFVGTLHTNTNPYSFLEGFYLFVTKAGLSPDDCNVTFTGSGFWDVENRYKRFASIRPYVKLEPPVPQEEAVERMCTADVLLSFPLDMEGCIPAKTYEYVASGRPILLSPGGKHRGAVKDVLERTSSGVVLDKPEEIARWLEKRYEEYEKEGMVSSHTDLKAAAAYSRREQAGKLAKILEGVTTRARG